jgi:transposase InsO family protein
VTKRAARLTGDPLGQGDRPLQDGRDPPPRPWPDFDEVEYAIREWVTWFNRQRLPGALGYLPPVEFEEKLCRAQAAHTVAVALT